MPVLARCAIRCALLVLLVALPLESFAIPVVHQWRFDVTADGIPIGTHDYLVRDDDGTRTVRSEMHFRVRFLVVDAYRYEHRATEHWQNGCLSQLDTHTEEHGRTTDVRGQLAQGRFEVDTANGRRDLPACVMTFAYWNPQVLTQSHLLNAQTGVWTPVTSEKLGADVVDVRGQPRKAERYRIMTGNNTIELWYATDSGDWLGMRTTTRDGHQLAYRLQ